MTKRPSARSYWHKRKAPAFSFGHHTTHHQRHHHHHDDNHHDVDNTATSTTSTFTFSTISQHLLHHGLYLSRPSSMDPRRSRRPRRRLPLARWRRSQGRRAQAQGWVLSVISIIRPPSTLNHPLTHLRRCPPRLGRHALQPRRRRKYVQGLRLPHRCRD